MKINSTNDRNSGLFGNTNICGAIVSNKANYVVQALAKAPQYIFNQINVIRR
jgi:hypothetical protein